MIFNLRDGRVGLIHRIHPNIQLAIFDDLDQLWNPPAGYWDAHLADLAAHTIIAPAEGALGVGGGAPPLESEDGLLLFFHERQSDGHYATKVALLDADTGRVRSLLPDPIMRPQLGWECFGDIDNIIFVQGAVAQPDGTIDLPHLRCCRLLRRRGGRGGSRGHRRPARRRVDQRQVVCARVCASKPEQTASNIRTMSGSLACERR